MPRLHTFTFRESLVAFDAAFAAAMRDRTFTRAAAGGSADVWSEFAGAGGAHRLSWSVRIANPGSGVTTKVIDSSTDWRERIVLVAAVYYGHATELSAVYPGHDDDDDFDSAVDGGAARALFDVYTRIGTAPGAVTNDMILIAGGSIRVYAHQSTGALMVDLRDTHPDPTVTLALRVWATEQLGERLPAPATVPALVAADGDEIVPADLNTLQDAAMLGQARSDLYELTDPRHNPVDAWAMGPAGVGDSILPETWSVRGVERRQPTVGAHRRFFAEVVANATDVLIDDSIDWRDRVIWGMGRRSSSDIRPGQAADVNHNAVATGIPWEGAQYTGRGYSLGLLADTDYKLVLSPTTDMALVIDNEFGRLYLRNDQGGTRYVTGMVEASFPVGPRTVPRAAPPVSALLRLAEGTFTRASAAMYRDGSPSVLASVGVDERRFEEWDDGWGPQLLLEGARTNLVPDSSALSAWAVATNLRARADGYAPGPLASSLAARIVSDGAGTVNAAEETGLAVTGGAAYSFSAWLKAGVQNAGGHAHHLRMADDTGLDEETNFGASGDWTFCEITLVTDPVAVSADVRVGVDPVGASAAPDFDDLIVWGAQLELGRFASSPIETSGGASARAHDLLLFTSAQVPTQLRQGASREDVWPVFRSSDLISGDAYVLWSFGGANDVLRFRHDGAGVKIEAVVGGAVVSQSKALTFSPNTHLRFRVDAAAGTIEVEGAAAGNGTGPAGAAWSWPSGVTRVGGTVGATDGAFCRMADIWGG